MDHEFYFLGLKILGLSNYNPAKPPATYFNIGQLIAVLALMLTFSQLMKPMVKFRFYARNVNKELILSFVGLSIISVFIANLLPYIPGDALPIFGYPIFWEFLGGIILVSIGLNLIYKASNSPIFKASNSAAYFTACSLIIAKGNHEELNELAEEISPSISNVFIELFKYNRSDEIQAQQKGYHYEIKKSTRIASDILDIWSDKRFCRSIITRAPRTAIEIFNNLISRTDYIYGFPLCNNLLEAAFLYEDSILMREEEFSGFGFFKKFTKTIFGNWDFVDSRYSPLESIAGCRSELKTWQVLKYCECLELALNSYFLSNMNNDKNPRSLSTAIRNLSSIASLQISQLNYLSSCDTNKSDQAIILDNIASCIKNCIEITCEKNSLITKDIDVTKYDHMRDSSIFGVLAKGVYDYMVSLSYMNQKGFDYRMPLIDIWMAIFGISSSPTSKQQDAIAQRLVFRLNEKIEENMNLDKMYYPAITRVLIKLNGIYELKDKTNDTIHSKFHTQFIDKIKSNFYQIYQKDRDYAIRLLPDDVYYDEKNNQLIQRNYRNDTYILKILK